MLRSSGKSVTIFVKNPNFVSFRCCRTFSTAHLTEPVQVNSILRILKSNDFIEDVFFLFCRMKRVHGKQLNHINRYPDQVFCN